VRAPGSEHTWHHSLVGSPVHRRWVTRRLPAVLLWQREPGGLIIPRRPRRRPSRCGPCAAGRLRRSRLAGHRRAGRAACGHLGNQRGVHELRWRPDDHSEADHLALHRPHVPWGHTTATSTGSRSPPSTSRVRVGPSSSMPAEHPPQRGDGLVILTREHPRPRAGGDQSGRGMKLTGAGFWPVAASRAAQCMASTPAIWAATTARSRSA